mmetsp:Transcript_3068/g.11148  ORF Transcript_3068/g.11148 Transcript_3068/m.11148 type:complete len:203 (-) Transcript_3068:718-1326(-)
MAEGVGAGHAATRNRGSIARGRSWRSWDRDVVELDDRSCGRARSQHLLLRVRGEAVPRHSANHRRAHAAHAHRRRRGRQGGHPASLRGGAHALPRAGGARVGAHRRRRHSGAVRGAPDGCLPERTHARGGAESCSGAPAPARCGGAPVRGRRPSLETRLCRREPLESLVRTLQQIARSVIRSYSLLFVLLRLRGRSAHSSRL